MGAQLAVFCAEVVMWKVLGVLTGVVLVAALYCGIGWLFAVAYNYVMLDWAGLDWPRMHWGVGVATVFLLSFLKGGGGK